jgi:hypothetical protein
MFCSARPVRQQLSRLDVEHVDDGVVRAADGLSECDQRAVGRRLGEHQHLVRCPSVGIQHRLEWRVLPAPEHQLELLVTGVRLPEKIHRPATHRLRQPRVARGASDRFA